MIKKLILLAFVALGVGMAIPSTRATMMEKAKPVMDKVRARVVPGRLEAMADQLVARVGRGESLPTGENFNNWLRRDFTSVPEDPWGNRYYLETSRSGFTVGSLGPDGQQRTEDDIQVTRRYER